MLMEVVQPQSLLCNMCVRLPMSMLGGGLGLQWNLLLTDTPNKGHCIKYLSTMGTTKSPNFNPPINIMQLESLRRGQVPKCPLFGDSTV